MTDLSKEIQSKAEIIAEILKSGNSAEIKRNTDGSVKVYEIKRLKR